MKLKFDLEIESLRLKRDFGISVPESVLLEEFNKYYSERAKYGCFFISIPTTPRSISDCLTMRQENIIGTGILQQQSIIDINISKNNYKFFEEEQDNYILSGRWIADKDGKTKPRLISVHICTKNNNF